MPMAALHMLVLFAGAVQIDTYVKVLLHTEMLQRLMRWQRANIMHIYDIEETYNTFIQVAIHYELTSI